MPKQVRIVVTELPDDQVNIQIGPVGYQVPRESLFDRSWNPEQIKNNLRLTHRIGNYGALNSAEFRDAVNKTSAGLLGMEAGDERYFISAITLVDPASGLYEVGFGEKQGSKVGPTIHTIQVYQHEIDSDPQDEAALLLNIPAFTRVSGHASLTTACKAALAAHNWWV